MKKFIIITSIIGLFILAVALLKSIPAVSGLIWNASGGGTWLLPLVLISSLLDSVHPCSFSILLITIAFLFSMQMSRKKILQIGGVYVLGIFVAYASIGLGILKVLHLFNTPHFMGKLGAGLLIGFGFLNIITQFFPRFPIKLKLPSALYKTMGSLMEKVSFPAAFGLGLLVGICQFPCMGGPYLMIIGLLRDTVTYVKGFGYLVLYNVILILPLLAVLFIAADKLLIEKVQQWKREKTYNLKLWAGLVMVVIGALILFL